MNIIINEYGYIGKNETINNIKTILVENFLKDDYKIQPNSTYKAVRIPKIRIILFNNDDNCLFEKEYDEWITYMISGTYNTKKFMSGIIYEDTEINGKFDARNNDKNETIYHNRNEWY